MQVVILAAGMGKRLKEKTKENTKCMVKIHDKTLIEYSLDILTDPKNKISRIIIVVGYYAKNVKDLLGTSYNGVPLIYVENPNYATTNNIYSLFLTKDYLIEDDTLLLESDLIYEKSIIDHLLNDSRSNIAVVDKYRPWMDGTVVKINEEHEITSFIPKKHFNYSEIDQYYKTVNIYKFSKKYLQNDYLPFLTAYCTTLGLDQYYEQVLRVLLTLEKNDLKALVLNGEKWYEIDDIQDYTNAEVIFSQNMETKYDLLSKRYGGYWRFDGLKDFCYLVNPYFPTKRLMSELSNCLDVLTYDYPSGQQIQKILVSNTWDCDAEHIIVGNGAAEIINHLMSVLIGRIGVMYPTFEEYPNKLDTTQIVPLSITNSNFSYSTDFIIENMGLFDSFILINPDNPSGNFIDKNQLLFLVDTLKKHNKILILDESFVDFSDEGESMTLFNENVISQYDNLVVVKSISKSYGVPGLRLGIMATSNAMILSEMKKRISIWNINSYAEFFLQIIVKYKNEYRDACRKIALNRAAFFKSLTTLPFLRPIPSQANYILCEVLPPYTSRQLALHLLEHNIFIKDCSSKKGFNSLSYIRLAVKSAEDNNLIINSLRDML